MVWSLAGKLRHITTVVRAARYFVWRSFTMTGLDEGNQVPGNTTFPSKGHVVVRLAKEFHGDLSWWKWAVQEGLLQQWVSLYAQFFKYVQRTPT